MEDREAALLRRVAGGESAAMEELYHACAGRVLAYLLSRGLGRQEAADVLQETFLAAWRGAGRYQGGSRLLTWLIGIARHKLADWHRRRPQEAPLPEDGPEPAWDPTRQTAEQVTLRQAVAALEADQRELLDLIFQQGLNYGEVAEVLGVPEGTIKSRMHRLKRELAERMA